MKKKDFAKLLKEVVDKHFNHSVLGNDFRKCELYPWDPTVPWVAGYKKDIIVQNAMQIDNLHSRLKYTKQEFQFLNEGMWKDKLELFEQARGSF